MPSRCSATRSSASAAWSRPMGFYEWRHAGKVRDTMYFHPAGIAAFAGLWARVKTDAGELRSFTIVTGPAGRWSRQSTTACRSCCQAGGVGGMARSGAGCRGGTRPARRAGGGADGGMGRGARVELGELGGARRFEVYCPGAAAPALVMRGCDHSRCPGSTSGALVAASGALVAASGALVAASSALVAASSALVAASSALVAASSVLVAASSVLAALSGEPEA